MKLPCLLSLCKVETESCDLDFFCQKHTHTFLLDKLIWFSLCNGVSIEQGFNAFFFFSANSNCPLEAQSTNKVLRCMKVLSAFVWQI